MRAGPVLKIQKPKDKNLSPVFMMSSGEINGVGHFVINVPESNNPQWSGGSLTGGGLVDVSGDLAISGFVMLRRDMDLHGKVKWAGHLLYIGSDPNQDQNTLRIMSGSRFYAEGVGEVKSYSGGNFRNEGLLVVGDDSNYKLRGTQWVQTGKPRPLTVTFDLNSFTNTGNGIGLVVLGGASLRVKDTWSNSGTINLPDNGQIILAGTGTVNSGTNIIGTGTLGIGTVTIAGRVQLNSGIDLANFALVSPARITGGKVFIRQSFTWSGGTIVGCFVYLTGTQTINATGSINDGFPGVPGLIGPDFPRLDASIFDIWPHATVNLNTFSLQMANGALMRILPDATFNSIGMSPSKIAQVQQTTLSEVDVYGTFVKTADHVKLGGGTTIVTTMGVFKNDATLNIVDGILKTPKFRQIGELHRKGKGEWTTEGFLDLEGGSLVGAGSASEIAGDVLNVGGQIYPGMQGRTGILSIDNTYGTFTQRSGGSLNINIGGYTAGSGFDQVNISSQAVLAGTLNVNLINAFTPNLGDSFTIINYGSHTGDFQTVSGLVFGSLRFDERYNSTNLTLVVVSNTSASAPSVTGVSPSTGTSAGGTSVTISGSNFTGATDVSFGGIPANSFVVNSDSSITAVSPPDAAGVVDVRVTTRNGTSSTSASDQFTYTASPVPTITGVSPNQGSLVGENDVIITGTNFLGTTSVSFGGTPSGYFVVQSSTQIMAVVPFGAVGTVDVRVTTYGGTSAITSADQYTFVGSPTVSSITTTSGGPAGGTVIAVTGTNFLGAVAVLFGGVPANSFTVNSNTLLTVVEPASTTGTFDIQVVTPAGTSPVVAADQFSYTTPTAPVVSGVSPSSGTTGGGTIVNITGSGFTGATAVSFGTVAATSFTVYSDSTITATAPPQAAGTVDITVTTPSGPSAVASADHYTYSAATAPSVTAVSPNTGTTAGGTLVTITGSGFTGASSVSFGSVAASSFSVLSDSSIVAISPAQAAGTVDVTVTTPSGTSSTGSADHFGYTAAAAPSVTAISPSSGLSFGGTTVTIYGSGFTGASAVSFGSLAASSFYVIADNQVVTSDPGQAAGAYDITVTTPSGTSSTSSADRFTDTAPALPVISGLSTTSGTSGGGTSVTLTGSGFTGATAVAVDGILVTNFTVNSDTQLTLVTPPGSAGTWDVTVTTPAGTSALASGDRFTYNLASNPSVTSLSTSSGSGNGGTAVLITGTAFTGASAVLFGTMPAATFTVNSDTSITAIAPPEAAATVDVIVTTPSGTSAAGTADQFTFSAAATPGVNSLSTTSGTTAGGTVVTVTGTGFTGATAVTFGGVPALSFTVYSDSNLVAVTPPEAAGTVDTQVTAPGGRGSQATLGDRFTYSTASVPSVSGVAANSGTTPGGNLVVITGSAFTGATGVTFGSLAATDFTVYADNLIVATAPPSAAGTVDIKVTTIAGTSSAVSADHYTYTNITASAPAVTAVSPNTGSTAGGQVVSITGTNFSGATAVKFGSTAASSFTINSDSSITATAPAGSAGTVDITVTTNNGTSSTGSADQFTYLSTAAPTVTGISPTSGSTAGGTSLTITGTNFSGATAVAFGGVAASSFTVNSSTSITATSPPEPTGTVDLTVTTPSGTSATGSPDLFTYTAASVPTVSSLGTTSGSTAGGTSVTVTGTNFTGATGVFFGGVAASSFTVSSSTSITATSPPSAAGTYDVTVSTYSGTSAVASGDRFTYNLAAAPSVTSVSPTSGSTAGGTSVTVTGSAFTAATAVYFGATPAASYTVNSDTSITATSPPEAAGTVDITVQTPSGSSAVSSSDHFTFTSASTPSVTGVSPTSGTTGGGTTVTISGSAFTGATAVTFGTVAAASFTVNSDSSITAISPPEAAGTVDITVTTYAGTSSTGSADHYTYNAASAPSVTSVSPSSGSTAGGTTVAIFGSGFTGASAVSFGTTAAATFTVESDSAILATAPSLAAGTVDITVTTPSGTSSTGSADHFTASAAAVPAITSLSATSGNSSGGSVITISGSGFTGATGVSFGNTAAATFTVNSDTLLTVPVPGSTAGIWDVTITGPGGTSALASADRFTFNATSAPTVTSLATGSGSTAGGTVVSITGTNFTGATGVSFGTLAAASFTVISSTQILATSPAQAAGTIDVTVSTPTGTSVVSSSDHFTYNAASAPSVTAVSPTSGSTAGGTVVTITGSGFTGATAVSFGTVAASFTVYTDGSIVATAPAQAAGTVDITVTTPSGTSSTGSADHFTYSAAAAPVVKGILPTSGTTAGGTVVTISGSGFTGATAVQFGSTAATSYTILSDTAITAIAPAEAAGTVDITVTTPGGTSATGSADQFTYSAIAAPAVTAVSPSSGSTTGGTVVSLTGTNFTGAYLVYFGTAPAASFTVISDTTITVVAPAQAAGTVDIQVATANGLSATGNADHYAYNAATGPSVTGVSPSSGSTGGTTVVTITGSGFTAATAVTFGTVAATSYTVNSDTTVTAVAPPQAAGTIDITVTTPSGTSSTGSADHFTYSATAAPTVTSVTPTSGPTGGGTVVTIFGTNLLGITAVSFGGTAGTIVTSYSGTAVIATAPAHAAGTVDITVTTYGGTSATGSADHYTYTAGLFAGGSAPLSGLPEPNGTPGSGLSGQSVELYVDNSNGDLTSDEVARISDAVAAIDATVAPFNVSITLVTDPTLATETLRMDTSCILGGMADGVLGCTDDGITLIAGWDWYAGSDSTQLDPTQQYDFQTAVTHELGHSLGIGHNAEPTSVMYPELLPGDIKRTLTAGDTSVADTDPGPGALHAAVLFPQAARKPTLGSAATQTSLVPAAGKPLEVRAQPTFTFTVPGVSASGASAEEPDAGPSFPLGDRLGGLLVVGADGADRFVFARGSYGAGRISSGTVGELPPLDASDDRPWSGEFVPEYPDRLFGGGILLAGENAADTSGPLAVFLAGGSRAGDAGLRELAALALTLDRSLGTGSACEEELRLDRFTALPGPDASDPRGLALTALLGAAALAPIWETEDRRRRWHQPPRG
jgi:hypothetical protein